MNNVNIKIILFILLFVSIDIFAQVTSLDFERISINQGISNNSINSIIQTSDGFLWIATKDGLNRYDGNSYKVFKNNSSDTLSLQQNYVMSLFEDSNRHLWVGTWGGGLSKYDPYSESFINYNFPQKYDDYVQCIFEDQNNNLWIGSLDGGLNKINREKGEIINYSSLSAKHHFFPSNNVTYITQFDSMLFVCTWDNGLFLLNTKNNYYKQFMFSDSNYQTENNNLIWDMVKVSEDKFLLASNNGIVEFSPNAGIIARRLKGNMIRKFLKDKRERIWIGTYDYHGIFLHTDFEKNKNYYNLTYTDYDPYTLTCNRIRWLYEDRFQNIWIGTEDGLNKLPKSKDFFQYRYFPLGTSSLGGRIVSSIIEGKDKKLWVSFGGGGFNRIDLTNKESEHFINDPLDDNSLSANDVITLFEDNNGSLWIGTSNGGLNKFNPKKNQFTRYLHNYKKKSSIKSNWVQQIIELGNDTLLIGTNESLEIFDQNTGEFQSFTSVFYDSENILPKTISVNALFKDSKDNIWIGTWLNGLFQYNIKEKKAYHFLPEKGNSYSLSSNKVTSICEDSKNKIWVGTHSGGLNKLDTKEMKFTHYNTQNGMPNDVIFGVLEDDNGYLWVSTMNGLVRLKLATDQIRIYDKSDGLINNQFNWHAYHKNNEGILYFGGINGFVSFNPRDIQVDSLTQPVTFLSFKVNNSEIKNSKSLISNNVIELDYYQNFFSVEFTVLDFKPPIKHNYLYKLSGLDNNWIKAGVLNAASYTDIKPGEYEFLVKASNPDGFWSKASSLKIIINAAWWMTWWFNTLSILFVGVIGIFVYKFRVRQLLEIERIKLNISRDLHDEIGSNLSSISVESQMLMHSVDLNNDEKSQLEHIKKVSIQTMEAMRDIVWFINPQNEWGQDFLLKLKETASNLLIGIKWEFIDQEELNLSSLNLETKRNIFLIYKEILINVTKHSKADRCKIKISSYLNNLIFEIHDNGIGFDKNNLKRKNGLINIQKRTEKINGTFTIDSVVGNGTTLIITINR